jgi:hypothetical protein
MINLIKLLNYNEESGVLTWNSQRQGVNRGDVAGGLNDEGYQVIWHKRKMYSAHRLIWLMVHGESPETVDHINHIKTDNRLCNLRAATQSENSKNRRSRRGSSSRFLGVSWNKARRKWRSAIKENGILRHLGSFDCEKAAARAYDEAAVIAHGEFANPNFKT